MTNRYLAGQAEGVSGRGRQIVDVLGRQHRLGQPNFLDVLLAAVVVQRVGLVLKESHHHQLNSSLYYLVLNNLASNDFHRTACRRST